MEMRSRIQHQTEAILSSNDDGQGQAIIDLTTSSVEQGIVKQLSERRKKKLDRLAPSLGLAKRRHNRKRALAWRKRRREVKEKREKSIAKERTALNTPAGDAVALETSVENSVSDTRKDTPPVAAPTTVVNLSECPLSSDEVQLLSKGLSFCPTPPHLNSTQVLDDLERYNRRLRLKNFLLARRKMMKDLSGPQVIGCRRRDAMRRWKFTSPKYERMCSRAWRPAENTKQRTISQLVSAVH